MNAFVRYTTGLGDAAIYARIRNAAGEFWDFVALGFVTPITADCKEFLVEVADGDPTTSYYGAAIAVPTDAIYSIEVVLDSDGTVLGYESTRDAILAGVYVHESGTVQTDVTNSIISILTDLASTVTGYCVGAFIKFTDGNCVNQVRKVSGYGGTSKLLLVSSGFTDVPDDGSRFILINQ